MTTTQDQARAAESAPVPRDARTGRRTRTRLGPGGAVLLTPAIAGLCFLMLPLVGILTRAPWSNLGHYLADHDVLTALRISLFCSFISLGLAIVLGVPLAWLFARFEFPGKALLRSLVTLPLVLPPTVAGVALLLAFGRRGVLGPALAKLGVTLPFSTAGAVLAATFVSLPFLVVSVEGAIAGLDPSYEEAAVTCGASTLRVFFTITMPLVGPGLAAGAALAWARALGEFGATITFAGNLAGVTQTLPLKVYLLLEDDPTGATALSLVLLAVAVVVLTSLRRRWVGVR